MPSKYYDEYKKQRENEDLRKSLTADYEGMSEHYKSYRIERDNQDALNKINEQYKSYADRLKGDTYDFAAIDNDYNALKQGIADYSTKYRTNQLDELSNSLKSGTQIKDEIAKANAELQQKKAKHLENTKKNYDFAKEHATEAGIEDAKKKYDKALADNGYLSERAYEGTGNFWSAWGESFNKGAWGFGNALSSTVNNTIGEGLRAFENTDFAKNNVLLGNRDQKTWGESINDFANYYKRGYEESAQTVASDIANGVIPQVLANSSSMIMQMTPDLIAAGVTGLISKFSGVPMQTMSRVATSNTGMLTKTESNAVSAISNTMKTAASDPMLWGTYLQTYGPTYDQAIEAGATKEQATLAALLNSTVASFIEVGGGYNTVEIGKVTGFKDFLQSSFEEGGEEILQNWWEASTNAVVYNKDAKVFSLSDDDSLINPLREAEAFMYGTIGGMVVGGVRAGAGKVAQSAIREINKLNKGNLLVLNQTTGQLANEIQAVYGEGSELYALAEKLKTGKTSAYETGDIFFKYVDALANDYKYEVQTKLKDSGMTNEEVKQSMGIVEKMISREPLNNYEIQFARNNQVLYSTMTERGVATPNRVRANAEYVNPYGESDNRANEPTELQVAAMDTDGYKYDNQLALVDKTGTAVALNDNTNGVLRAVSSLAKNAKYSQETANVALNVIRHALVSNDADLTDAVKTFNDIYMAGKNNEAVDYAMIRKASIFSAGIAKEIYNQGVKDNASESGTKVATKRMTGKVGRVFGVESISEEEAKKKGVNTVNVNDDSLSEKQKSAIGVLKRLSDDLHIKFALFESSDEDIKHHKGDNGWYNPFNNTIYIDIKSGNLNPDNTFEEAILRTAAHELTHYIKAWNRSGYEALKKYAIGEIVKRDGIAASILVNRKVEVLKADGYTKPDIREVAMEEVIADGCEMMLYNPDVALKILKEKRGLYGKIVNFVKEFKAMLKKAFKGVEGTSFENAVFSKILNMDKLEGIWSQALLDASNNMEMAYDNVKNVWYSKETGMVLNESIYDPAAYDSEYVKEHPEQFKDYYEWKEKNDKVDEAEVKEDESGIRHSYSSIGYTFFGDENINVNDFLSGDYKKQKGYIDYLNQCVDIFSKTHKGVTQENARAEIEASIKGIVDVAIAAKKAGYDILDDSGRRNISDSKGRLLFSSLEPNSDYLTSNDISTICDKRLNFAGIYDAIVKRETEIGVPANKRFFNNVDNYFYIHKVLADKGLTTPCRQCYVESMRKNLMPMAQAFIKLVSETNPDNKKNDQLYQTSGKDKGKLKENNAKLRERVLELLGEYGMNVSDITINTLTTADGLAQLKITSPLLYEAFNSFYGQSKPKMPKEATPFRFGELTALLTDGNGNIKKSLVEKINSTGGFRLQSYSDFQIANYVDVLQVIFEAGVLGLNGHAYTKVPAFLDATEGTNLKRNISIFMYKDGTEWKLDRNDSFPATSVEDIYDIVNADKSGNTSIIAVSQNADMSAFIMANDNIGYGIPFHKSGLKMGTVRDTIVREGGREIKGYSNIKDHTKQQTEVWAKAGDGHKALTKVKKGINIYGDEVNWDFENKRNLSKNDLIKKNIKSYIDACENAGYLPKFREYVMNNEAVLNNVLKYAKNLGYVSEGATIDDISFEYKKYTIPYGYYKFLGDFGMFTPDGEAAPHETLSLANYDFEKAVNFFTDAEKLRRNEILQQFANGEERQKYRESGLTAGELADVIAQKRAEAVDEIVDDGIMHSKRKVKYDRLSKKEKALIHKSIREDVAYVNNILKRDETYSTFAFTFDHIAYYTYEAWDHDYHLDYVISNSKILKLSDIQKDIMERWFLLYGFEKGYPDLRTVHKYFSAIRAGEEYNREDFQVHRHNGEDDNNDGLLVGRRAEGYGSNNVEGEGDSKSQEIRKSSRTDNAGRQLTDSQVEYFLNSKVRDKDGNLLTMYHGTKADFTEFKREFIGSTGAFEGAGFNFTPYEGRAKSYGGRVMEEYLNVTNPLSAEAKTMSVRELAKIIAEIDPTGDNIISNYARDTRDYGSTSFVKRESLVTARAIHEYAENDVDIYSQMSSASGGDVSIIQKFQDLGYDGLIHYDDDGNIRTVITFDSNQAKNTDNLQPTDNPDTRFSKRSEDALSTREILANALLSTAQNEDEKNKLKNYKDNIEKLNKLNDRLSEVNSQIKDITFTAGSDRTQLPKLYKEKEDLLRKIDWHDKRLLTLEATKPLKDVKDRAVKNAIKTEREKAKQKMDDLRTRSAEKVREERKKGAEKLQNYKEIQARKKLIKKISDNSLDIIKWITRPTDKKHVHDRLEPIVMQFLFSLDFVTDAQEVNAYIRALSGVKIQPSVAKWYDAMEQLRIKLNDLTNEKVTDAENMATFIDPDLTEKMKAFHDKFNGIKVEHIDEEGIETLDEIISGLKHMILDMNKLYANDMSQNARTLALNTIDENNYHKEKGNVSKYLKALDKLVNISSLDAYSYFNMLGDSALSIFKELRNGFNVRVRDLAAADKWMKELYATIDKDELASWDGKKARLIEMKDVDGKTFTMTPAQLMFFYTLSRREQALQHILAGGIKIKLKDGNTRQSKVENYHFDRYLLGEIFDNYMTPEMKRVAEAMQEYESTVVSDWGNAVSLIMYGYKKFKEKFYARIETDSTTRDSNIEANKFGSLYSILNQGFTKATTPNAKNAILVDDIFDAFTSHVSDMATYHAYAIPISDAMKWYNYHVTENDDGIIYNQSTRDAITRAYGSDATQYFVNLIKDINGDVSKGYDSEIANSFMGKYKAQSVAANLRVIVQQPTAYIRASALISPKYLVAGLSGLANLNELKNQMVENSEIARWKSWGYFETMIGQSMKSIITGKKSNLEKISEAAMKPAQMADDMTWAVLWNAVKEEQHEAHPDMDINSQEFIDTYVKPRFDQVIDETQVVDSTLHRSQIMRSTDGLVKVATAFMAEPTKSYNMMRNRIFKAIEKFRDTGNWDKELIGNALRAVMAFVFTAFVNSLAESLIDAIRRRDKDEYDTFIEQYMTEVGKNFADDINPLNLLPYTKEIVSLFDGYDSSRMDTAAIANIISCVTTVYSDLTSGKNVFTEKNFKNVARAISGVTGIPVYNVYRDVSSLPKLVAEEISPKKASSINKDVIERLDSGSYADAHNAVVKSINVKASELRQTYPTLSDDALEKKAISYVKSAITSEYKERYAEAYLKKNTSEMAKIKKSIESTELYDDVDDTLKDWVVSYLKDKYIKASTKEQANIRKTLYETGYWKSLTELDKELKKWIS